ncbi:hypothetical protein [Acaricomes phytoseiuli]|uniref:hypothetical protein n=1 Tax=Acaricomes phytoseiuli TaxID=291968 RepID=UPI000A052179|nr:hypothetical protein [Acaricomes phytoseiuli]
MENISTVLIELQASPLMASGGIFGWFDDKTSQAERTIQGLLIVLGLVVAIIIAWKRTITSIVLAILLGGLIMGLPTILKSFSGKTGEEFASGVQQASIVTVQDPSAEGQDLYASMTGAGRG